MENILGAIISIVAILLLIKLLTTPIRWWASSGCRAMCWPCCTSCFSRELFLREFVKSQESTFLEVHK